MKFLDEAFNRACGRYSGSNFDQYYFNSSGDLAFYAPIALRSIGAHQMAKITDDANKLFGPKGPAPNSDERQAQLLSIAPNCSVSSPWDELDRAFYSYPDDISMLLTGFLQAHGRVLG